MLATRFADLPAALQARLTVLEEQAASRQAQLDVLTSQQGELQRLVLRLADGLDALRGQAAAADVAALKQQVGGRAWLVADCDVPTARGCNSLLASFVLRIRPFCAKH